MGFTKTGLTAGQKARSEFVLQIIEALDGTANRGQPIALTKLSSSSAYALDVQNLGTGGAFRVKQSDGDILLDATDSGLTLNQVTLTSPVLTTPQINDTSGDHQYVFAVSELVADRTVTLPLLGAADEFVFKDHAVTLTNKTLTTPVINGAVTTTGLTLPAFTLGGTVSGGGQQLNNVIIGTVTPLAGSFTTISASGGATVTAGSLGVNAAINPAYTVLAGGSRTTGTTSSFSVYANTTFTASGNVSLVGGLVASSNITVNGGTTTTRWAQGYFEGDTATVTGTLSNHNAIYCGTPVNGTTVRVIDTAAGGYLTTGGVWTDNPSWAEIKRDITLVQTAEVDSLLDWFATSYKPVRYRYADRYEDVTVPVFEDQEDEAGKTVQVQVSTKTERHLVCYERDSDNPHFGYLLDDLTPELREIVCADASGGIAGKDERGLLLALTARLAQRVKDLEAKVLV